MLFVAGLWPFNFTEKNNASVSPDGGLVFARHGTAYTAASPDKLHHLHQFAIYIDLVTSSDGLNSFEKIFSYFINQEEMNFLLGQWKDGLILHLRTGKQIKGVRIGSEGVLKNGERTRHLVTYDGAKLSFYQEGNLKRYRETGPLNLSNWDRTYPLVVGTDAGGRSQWKGTIYEIAVFDRPLSAKEIAQLSVPGSGKSDKSGKSGNNGKSLAPQATSHRPQGKMIASQQPTADSRKEIYEIAVHPLDARNDTKGRGSSSPSPRPSPLKGEGFTETDGASAPVIHYVFKQENTVETEFRGKKALGVRDLGKGEAADLVIPEQFRPCQRIFLEMPSADLKEYWRDRWDVLINLIGFIPLGLLLTLALSRTVVSDAAERQESGLRASGFGIKDGNRDSGIGLRDKKIGGEIVAHPLDARNDKAGKGNPPVSPNGRFATVTEVAKLKGEIIPFVKGGGILTYRETVLTAVMAVVAGLGLSLAIELIQAYLPSRHSSLFDVLMNTAGTMIGATAAAWLVRCRQAAAVDELIK